MRWFVFCLMAAAAAHAAGPAITSIDPSLIDAGGPYYPMTIKGSGFVNGSVARWDGNVLSTTFINSGQLQAQVVPELRLLSGGYSITITNPNLSVSPSYMVGVQPVLASVEPGAVRAGSAAVKLRIRGIGLTTRLVMLLSGPGGVSTIPLTFGDSTTMTATLPAASLADARSATIQLYDPQYKLSSSTVAFEIRATPAITSLSPNPIDAGGAYFQLKVAGSGFAPGNVATWADGQALGTAWVSATELHLSITPELRALAGSFNLTVTDPATSTTSNASPLTVSPVLFAISPATAASGSGAVNVTLTGAGFTPKCVVRAGRNTLTTTYASSTALSAVIPPELLQAKGTVMLQVADGGGAGISTAQTFTISQSAPTLSAISPSIATAGAPSFTLTATGTNCGTGCVIQWNGSALSTSIVSATQVAATVPASLVVAAGNIAVRLVNTSGAASNTATFVVNPAGAVLTSLAPASAVAGEAFALTVNGSGFAVGAMVRWNGVALATNYVSASQLTANVPATAFDGGLSAAVSVLNPGGAASNALSIPIELPRPSITAITPATVTAGGGAFTLAVSGGNFAAKCVVRWNGSPLSTKLESAGQVTAAVPADLIAAGGTAEVTVANPNGAISNTIAVTIATPPPRIDSINPATAPSGSGNITVSVAGAGFLAGSKVLWNGTALASRYGSGAQLAADVPAELLALAGTASVTVSTAGAASSNAMVFTIGEPVPATSSAGIVNAASGLPGAAPGSLISIFGSNLARAEAAGTAPLPKSLNGTSVWIDGIAAPLVFVSSGQINAQVPFEIAPGTVKLVVERDGLKSAPGTIEVMKVAPGVLPVVVSAVDWSVNSAAAPAHAGDYLTVWVTGQGASTPAVSTGDPGPDAPFASPVAPVEVRIGGVPATVAFAGLAPGLAGLMQVNVVAPRVAPGWHEVVVSVGGVASNAVMVAIE